MMKPAETLSFANVNCQIIFYFFERLYMYVHSFILLVLFVYYFKNEIWFSVIIY